MIRFTILGCGSSGGVPRVAAGWGACNPDQPRNRRRRCAFLIERLGPSGTTTVLIDTGPDLRAQLLDAGVTHLDGVIYTHDHADHTSGIDDLRPLYIHGGQRLDVYIDRKTSQLLMQRFGYCFASPEGSEYPPILKPHEISPREPFIIDGAGGGIEFLAVPVLHGSIEALSIHVQGVIYTPDVSNIHRQDYEYFFHSNVWIVDALRYKPHFSHFTVDEAVKWIKIFSPRRSILTNLHTDLDYDTLLRELPEGVEPAYDGLQFEMSVEE